MQRLAADHWQEFNQWNPITDCFGEPYSLVVTLLLEAPYTFLGKMCSCLCEATPYLSTISYRWVWSELHLYFTGQLLLVHQFQHKTSDNPLWDLSMSQYWKKYDTFRTAGFTPLTLVSLCLQLLFSSLEIKHLLILEQF